jgi:hypothetical protein
MKSHTLYQGLFPGIDMMGLTPNDVALYPTPHRIRYRPAVWTAGSNQCCHWAADHYAHSLLVQLHIKGSPDVSREAVFFG